MRHALTERKAEDVIEYWFHSPSRCILMVLGMEYLRGALPGEGCAAGAGRVAVGALSQRPHTNADYVLTFGAKGQAIGRIQITTTPSADESAPALRIAGIDALAAGQAPDDFDVMMAVIDHEAVLAFVAHHRYSFIHSL